MMRLSRNQYRMVCSALLIVAFFIPAYHNMSAFHFIGLAVSAVKTEADITPMDLLVVLTPLLFIPSSALLILFRAIRRKSFNLWLLSLPLFFLLFFFFLILSFNINGQAGDTGLSGLIQEFSIGFYLAMPAAVLLLFCYSTKESINANAKRRRHSQHAKQS